MFVTFWASCCHYCRLQLCNQNNEVLFNRSDSGGRFPSRPSIRMRYCQYAASWSRCTAWPSSFSSFTSDCRRCKSNIFEALIRLFSNVSIRTSEALKSFEFPKTNANNYQNAFNASMTGDIGAKGSCTTCTFSEDFSNYWTAALFFKHTNGSYKRVPLMENTALPNGVNGGMTIYYTQQDFNSNGNLNITAFKPVNFPIVLNKYHMLTDSGFPHDSWLSNNFVFGCCPGPRRTSFRLSW